MGLPATTSAATPQRWMPRAEVHRGARWVHRTDRRSGTHSSRSTDTHQMEGSVEFCSTYVRSRNRKMLRIMIWGQSAGSARPRPPSARASHLTRLPPERLRLTSHTAASPERPCLTSHTAASTKPSGPTPRVYLLPLVLAFPSSFRKSDEGFHSTRPLRHA